jgi:2-polyprenyl-3-methyl-5-hydroxy-6-metoxy-1,4-benzoquinol methylase
MVSDEPTGTSHGDQTHALSVVTATGPSFTQKTMFICRGIVGDVVIAGGTCVITHVRQGVQTTTHEWPMLKLSPRRRVIMSLKTRTQDQADMKPGEMADNQQRWNSFGITRRLEIERDPERYRISACPVKNREFYEEFLDLVTPLTGKQLLELGFGRGDLSVWLAQQGALVTGVELGQDLVSAASTLASLNGVSCDFRQGNISDLTGIASDAFDIVVGIAILHHLSQVDVLKTLTECQRVLKPGGIAVFVETVENSRWFDLLQNLIPAGKNNSAYYRPSILNRRRWKEYIAALDERAMTNQELLSAGNRLFRTTSITSYGFLIRLARLFGPSSAKPLMAIDRFLFRFLPPLRRYCRMVLVAYTR